MKAFLALSSAPSASADDLRERGRIALERFAGARAEVVEGTTSVVFVCDAAPDDVVDGASGEVGVLAAIGAGDLRGSPVRGRDIARIVREGTWTSVAPPFAAMARATRDAPVEAVTDTRGLRSIAYWSHGGHAAIASSALVLAAMGDLAFDEYAIGTWAFSGFLVDDQTMWRGVRRLAPGALVRMSSGEIVVEEAPRTAYPSPWPSREVAVAQGAEVVRRIVSDMAEANPDCAFELSGGLDSRTVVAAAGAAHRRGKTAITLGALDRPDAVVAREIAQLCGMEHELHFDPDLPLEPAAIDAAAHAAAIRRDCYANPLAMAMLDVAEASLPQVPRFNGQAAEFAQGRYYPSIPARLLERMPASGRHAHMQVDLLAKVRFFTNHRVDPGLFAPGFLDDVGEWLSQHMYEVAAGEPNFARATEAIYHDVRVRGWVGAEYNVAAMHRRVLAPFFHPDYVEWARRCRPHLKQGASVFAEMLTRLDPALAAIPVNGGLTPFEIADTGVTARARRWGRGLQRAERKVHQRLQRREKPPAGAALYAPLIVESWARTPARLERVSALAPFDERAIDQLLTGRRSCSSGSVALLANVLFALEFCGDVAAA